MKPETKPNDLRRLGNNRGNFGPYKADDEKKSSRLNIAVLTAHKSAWVKAAQSAGVNLTNWVIKALNKSAGI